MFCLVGVPGGVCYFLKGNGGEVHLGKKGVGEHWKDRREGKQVEA